VKASFLLYGAYGYTGRLVAAEAVARGHRPLLAGRDPQRLEALATELGLPYQAFSLEDSVALASALGEVPAVLCCAGPFIHTWRPVAEACLATGRHYLDITGEPEVFLCLAALDQRAERAGVILLPGVGFDVVPSDCLAAHLARRLPGATSLTLAFRSGPRPSRGTAATMIEHAHRGGLVRRGGELAREPVASRTLEVDFGQGPVSMVSIPWGDVVTAWYTTGIPDIEVYTAASAKRIRRVRLLRPLLPLLRIAAVKAMALYSLRARPEGPSEEELAHLRSDLWGEVRDAAGRSAASRLHGPQSHRWTAKSAVSAVERLLEGDVEPGFRTPASAFGPDFVLETGEVERHDLPIVEPTRDAREPAAEAAESTRPHRFPR
jgi:short subunit dehydrogenase-like uncharacterized protein